VPVTDDNRLLFCQMAIESSVQDLVEVAMRAGWNEREILASLIDVADNLMLEASTNEEVEDLLKAIRKRNGTGR